MKTPVRILVKGLPLVLLPLSIGGCATPALWHGTAARHWRPGSPDQLLLFVATNQQPNVAVFFTQSAATKGLTKSRCVVWCLGGPPSRLIIGTNAIRQFTNSLASAQKVPLFLEGETPAATMPSPAVWSSTNQQLTVHIEGVPTGPLTLPASHERTRTALRVVGLPFAVATDAVIGLGAIFVWAGPGLGAGAGP